MLCRLKQDISEFKMSIHSIRRTLTIAVLINCLCTGSGVLIQKPQDSEAVVGKSTYLNCTTSEPSKRIQWFHYNVGEEHREAIYHSDNFTEYWYPCYRNGRYVIERNQAAGEYNLIMPTVVSSDAGRFLCEVDGDEGIASLTVRVSSDAGRFLCEVDGDEGIASLTVRAVDSIPTCVVSEVCKPYIDAIICIFLIILPLSIVGTVFTLWYLHVYRRNKRKQSENKGEKATEELTSLNYNTPLQEDSEKRLHTLSDFSAKISELEEKNAKNDITITELQTELECKTNEATKYSEDVQRQSQEIEKLLKQNQKSESENNNLKARMNDLEKYLYPAGNIDYAEKPTVVHKLTADSETKERFKPINGMTILGQELFVLHENSSTMKVYNSDTFEFARNLEVDKMSHPLDIASNKIVNCLYILFKENDESENRILKLHPNGVVLAKWTIRGGTGRLSTHESNVIVCLFDDRLIEEYTNDGTPIRTVHLSPAGDLSHPWHAIKVTDHHFAVCLGDKQGELSRVCIVDDQGTIVKEFRQRGITDKPGKPFGIPICLVEDSERSILVADKDNQSILLLDCFLQYKRCLIKRETGLDNLIKKETGLDNYPVRICLDETKSRLVVAENTLRSNKREWKEGRILIFNIK